jgi:5-oxoprolinase (ATP-hydrolysing)
MTDHHAGSAWEFWIDRGGTFTDIVARRPDGTTAIHKLLSDNPEQYRDSAVQGIRDILGVEQTDKVPIEKIRAIKMGTTVATNALLERKGEPTLLLTTKGFRDALRIGYQNRPDLFALNIELPEQLYAAVQEVDERITASGEVLVALDESGARASLQKFYDQGLRSVAIALMHGYRYHDHEIRLLELAQSIGFSQVSASHRVSPLMKFVSRGDTTVVDAYLSPILRRYVEQISSEFDGLASHSGRLKFMQSNGGLTDARYFDGKDAILSGPAGGVVGMARVCEIAGFDRVIGFDMGGTSTDVSHYGGEFEKVFHSNVAGVRIRAPMMLIHTVAAGGGSKLHFDGARYRVGPDSAGAHPGPASYRNGGPLTVTDCNVMLGKLQPQLFPKIFGPGANQALDKDACAAKFSELAEAIRLETGNDRSPEQVAAGFLEIAVQNMANAIKTISVQRGYDVTTYTLCCFGGAGGQHACFVADALGISRIFLHSYAGVLSAYGMGLADTIVSRHQAVEAIFESDLMNELGVVYEDLERQSREELAEQGEAGEEISVKRSVHLRYEGSDTAIIVNGDEFDDVVCEFEKLHKMRFGFISPNKDLIVESVEVEAIALAASVRIEAHGDTQDCSEKKIESIECFMEDRWRTTPVYERASLSPELMIDGPAVILDPVSTIVVEPGWRCSTTTGNDIILERFREKEDDTSMSETVDPVMLEVFNNLFMSIAEQMGVVLENTAASVNIKERLDFSCAIFAPDGSLIANAPHMPSHLGSMGETIKTVIREREGDINAGDAYILNAPYNGGTHLPDVTIVKPIFSVEGKLLFYVASRGHHTDIGGTVPGSAPANSTSIEEEGVLIDNFLLVEDNNFREDEIYNVLTAGKWPSRNPAMNIADFKAQLAACEKGAYELGLMVEHYGADTVHSYMRHVQDNAEEAIRRVLETLEDGSFEYEMDCGSKICVSIAVDREKREATVDFAGTSAQHRGNLNAPKAVVYAAVLYTFRCLARDKIPLNEGCLRPLKVLIPDHSMISPEYPGAVISGNTETAQALVGTLFGALRIAASSQGTMNNFIWGNEEFQYYETICGGSGATPDHDGVDAVQTHMTNSRLTDPEILEWRFPVLLESFEIRQGSGGDGKRKGGNGVVRRVKFLSDFKANVLSGHRRIPPYGLEGGESGKNGVNFVEHHDGSVTQLSGMDQIALQPGDVFVIKTPGGGGYGEKK